MKTKSIEDMKVYNNSVDIAVKMYKITLQERVSKDYSYKDQLRRAVISISNNIAEGSEYQNNKQFIRFLYHSKGSAL